eukprot:CAMPEP_0117461628 /NCGR_PEP_ID=MMETSP0784-20121206/2626_1 /TAXON_ID=39447 /ORGANISM="" /LENGTH=331 /DNA_ID=CAMNT_0005255347 /DNA_START=1 /DNA_END=996 /DNA_ORIENTATION=-
MRTTAMRSDGRGKLSWRSNLLLPRRRAPQVVALGLFVSAAPLLVAQLTSFAAPAALPRSTAATVLRGVALFATPADTVDAVPAVAPASAAANEMQEVAKAKLMDLLDDEAVSQEILLPEGKPTRGRIDELILDLERLNPCDEPSYSELLDGSWQVKYSGSYAPGLLASPTRELALFLYGGGFSLGSALTSFAGGFWGQNLGLKLGAKKLRIDLGRDVEAVAEIEVAGQMQKLAYKAELLPMSARRLSEEIMSVELPDPIGKRDPPVELRRNILVTYLDNTMLIARDESGVPEVLVRELGFVTPSSAVPDATISSTFSDSDAAEDPMSSEAS